MSFALLEVDADGEFAVRKPKKKSKETGPKLTKAQKAILEERKERRKADKEAKEKATRCHYFDTCGAQRDSDWSYCKACFETRQSVCGTKDCKNPTMLTAEEGVFHPYCRDCRRSRAALGSEVE